MTYKAFYYPLEALFLVKKKARKVEKWVPQKKAVFDVMALIKRKRFEGLIENRVPFRFQ